ncbi:MAG: ATP-binding protein [Kiritimatiellia bacterium]
MVRRLILVCGMTSALFAAGAEGYLFSYFSEHGANGRRGEAAGLHLAYSYDGLKWTALNNDEPILEPAIGQDRLMRDPSICQGPDGTFHLVWTTGWRGRSIGYASSRDLLSWSEQRAIPVMADEPTARNCWAPEVTYNPEDGLFYIYWATTIPDRHAPIPEMDKKEAGLNHRIYLMTTGDFETFSPARLWFNPGFSVIDAAAVRDAVRGDWLVFAKNENHTPVEKNIRVVRTASLAKALPMEVGAPLTSSWTEGPSPLWVGDTLYLYFDVYRMGRYGALRSRDRGRTWQDVSTELEMPRGARHGTAFAVSRAFLENLIGADRMRARKAASGAPDATPAEPRRVTLSGLTMGAEKLLRYGERVKVDGELTYLVSEGADFRLTMDENGELTVVAVPGWWTPARMVTALVIGLQLFLAVLGWAFFLRHQKRAEARVNKAVQQERLRLSHDLHDGCQQLLAGCMFRLTAAQTLLGRGNIVKAEQQLAGLQSSLTHAQEELRAALWTMKEEAEGPAAMAALFRYAAARLPQWEGKVTFESLGEEEPLDRRYAGALLMILQEAVGNALRHGRAEHVYVKTFFGRGGFAVIIKDDGCGFDMSQPPADRTGVHLGLESMRTRAEKIGGRFHVRSVPGRGTEVKIVLEERR